MTETLMEQATPTNDGEQTSTPATELEQAPPAAEDAAPAGAPETYDLKPVEGQEFDSEFLKTYEETARELNLTNEAAQMMLDKLSPVVRQQQEARIEAVRTEWAETSKADKEFGGDKLRENLGVAKQALDKFGSDEFKKFINETGLGNHPEVIRFFYRAGKELAQDTFVGGHTEVKTQTGPRDFNTLADAMYNKH